MARRHANILKKSCIKSFSAKTCQKNEIYGQKYHIYQKYEYKKFSFMLQFPRNMILMKTYHKITANNNSHFLFLHLFFFTFVSDSVSPLWAGGLILSEKKDVYERHLLRTNFANLDDYQEDAATERSRRVYFHSMDTGHGPCHARVEYITAWANCVAYP